MKTRLAALALILVGVGAVALAIVGPSFAGSASSKYITSTVTVGTVSAQSVATGTVAASTVYGLKFGTTPDIVSSSATTSGTGGSTSSSNSSTTTVTWPVATVSATVGQAVKKGDALAVADGSTAQLQLATAQSTLATAQAKLATDKGGPDALTKAQALNQYNQAKNSYSQAVANRKITNQQNALSLSQAKQAVTAAQTAYNALPTGPNLAALQQAQASLATTQLRVNQSNQQASQQVTNASLSLTAAKLAYQGKLAPAASATIVADEAQVASAQATVDAAQLAVTAATIFAPADGLIIAVNILPGVNAPSGYAIEESVSPMVATASFTESDITNLKVGQSASVTVTAAKQVVAGTLSQIVPVASTSGGSSSVVTYAVTVTLIDPPAIVFSGMSATVTVTTASVANTLRVPATALVGSAASGYSVQVMGSDGSITTRTVEVGLVTTSMAQITNGLSQGDAVVVGTTSTRNSTTTTGGGGVNLGGLGGGGLGGGGFGR
jgi:multidrug efflux pump subunit AcrA (membrane-fusion protein)